MPMPDCAGWAETHPIWRKRTKRCVASFAMEKRASAVVARMRALFKKAPSANEPVDINDVFQEVLTLSQGEIQRNRVSLQTRYASDLPFVLGDRIQLQQVILNLVLTVRDSGPGLDPQLVDRLFEPFYTTKPQGLGMGLTISRSIIEAHGGRLWAHANAPQGAVFRFTLPI